MPRNGSNIYFIPPGTEGFPDTTIESAKYNTYIHDVETDLNRPRPISAGGTGADDADEALANLGAEKSSQEVINYDTHLFLPGSFYSKTTATAGPETGHAYVGFALSSDIPATPPANQNVVLRAYDQSSTVVPGRIWVREKKAGVWSAWTTDSTGAASATPPTNPPDGYLWFDSIGGHLYVWYRDVDSAQWVIASPFADPALFVLKEGGDTITNITVTENLTLTNPPVEDTDAANKKYVDDQDAALAAQINEDIVPVLDTKVSKTGDTMTGPLTVNSNITASGNINGSDFHAVRGGGNTGVLYCGSSGGQYLYFDGANWTLAGGGQFYHGGNLVAGSNIQTNAGYYHSAVGHAVLSASGGPVFFRPYGADNGTNQALVDTSGHLNLSGWGSSFVPPNGVPGGFRCKYGDSNALTGDYFNLVNQGGQAQFYIDDLYWGNIAFQSDYRIKKDVEPLPSTWETVKNLNPIKYTQKDFGEHHKADDIERWGFIAHELQETLVESASTGVKDQEGCIQAPNPFTIIAALTKALQEAMDRIEQLEERI